MIIKIKSILVFLLIANLLSAGDLDFPEISKIKVLKKNAVQIQEIFDNQHIYGTWIDDWPFEESREVWIQRLLPVYVQVQGVFELDPKNYSVGLVSAQIGHFLYNLDYKPAKATVERTLGTLIELNPDKPLAYFLLSSFALSSGQFEKAYLNLQEFETFLSIGKEPVWYLNLAFNIYMRVKMIARLDYVTRQMSKVTGDEPFWGPFEPLRTIAFQKPPLDTELPSASVWSYFLLDESKYHVYSPLLGISFPIENNASTKMSGFMKKFAYFFFEKEKGFVYDGEMVFPSTTVFVCSEKTIAEKIYSGWIEPSTSKTVKPVKLDILKNYEYKAWEVKDTSLYTEPFRKFSRIQVIVIEADEAERFGWEIEKPQMSDYFMTNPLLYRRLAGKIYYLFLLDSCETIWQDSLDDFHEFLENVRIDGKKPVKK